FSDKQTSGHVLVYTQVARLDKKLSGLCRRFSLWIRQAFMRSQMLGDKTDFYQNTTLYARMRGAGFMHVVAV
ncbi:MAG: hypothetical protein ILP14_03355, partial [Oscillospiraceae bacterium]|nr:hypothetical protein [Oscillospiraceae bacterium]